MSPPDGGALAFADGGVTAVSPSSSLARKQENDRGGIPVSRNLLKAAMPIMWRRFLRQNFHGPREVSQVFGVSLSTAYVWWSGDGSPAPETIIQVYEGEHAEGWRQELRREAS